LKELSIFPTEEEILLPAFCKFKILNIENTPEIEYIITMDCLYIDQNLFKVNSTSSIQKEILNDRGFIYPINKDHFTLENEIGNGGFGIVYSGKINVAIKTLNVKRMSQEDLSLFKHEITVMSLIKSPFIVQLFGGCFEEGHYSIIMEYLPHPFTIIPTLTEKQKYQIAIDIVSGAISSKNHRFWSFKNQINTHVNNCRTRERRNCSLAST
jgi:serine/threonine protein kinase